MDENPMISIDNARMRSLFAQADENRYFYDCHDITMAGRDGYKIKDIVYYAQDDSDPLASYACQKTYFDGSVVLYLYSRDRAFAHDVAVHLHNHPAREIDLCSPTWDVREIESVAELFEIESTEQGSPVFALCNRDALAPFVPRESVTCTKAGVYDRLRVQADPTLLQALEEELRSVTLFDTCPCFDDTRFYIMECDGRIIGFLRAECGYRNYYDVGWVYVAPAYRNKGYGKHLTLFFAHDCLANGLYPHYGYAVSPESVAVAQACGFACSLPSRTFFKLKRKVTR